jgi:RNA polymerase sigma-70 factor (ECF subfamily)
MNAEETPEIDRTQEFTRLLLVHQPRLYAMLRAVVFNWTDADDLMQQVALVMWRKFDTFTPGSDFGAWASSIARFEVMDYRKRKATSRVQFTDAVVDDLMNRMVSVQAHHSARMEAMQVCLSRMAEHDRRLIELRYEAGATTQGVAQAVGRSVDGVYKSLSRIRTQLFECVRERMATLESNAKLRKT